MIPIPQYPMYAAEISINHGTIVPYYLEESKQWGIEVRNAFTMPFITHRLKNLKGNTRRRSRVD
jgi:aspartate/methionine/tyrosine aminotransferase